MPPQSVAIEPLGSLTLQTDTWQETSKHVRIDSRSQLHFFADYNPHAANVGNSAVECEVQVLYSTQPGDTDQLSGDSGSFTWKGYVEEVDQGDGSSKFEVRTWRITADATENFDRDPCFSRPLASKVVKCRAREVGAGGSHGTVSISVAAQPI